MRTIALDSQVLNDVMACGYKAYLRFIRNKSPEHKAEALEKGDLMHRMLAYHYKQIKAGRKAEYPLIVNEAVNLGVEAASDMELSQTDVAENIMQYRQYALYYQQDGWMPIEVEQVFSKVLYESEEKQIRIIYEGIIDLVPQTPAGLVIVDHKTSRMRKQPFLLSTQFMGYSWAMNIPQVVVNKIGFQKTLSPKERFNRYRMPYQKAHIEQWKRDAIYYAFLLISWMDQGYFPMNYTSCDKYGGCIFQPVCGSIPEVREHKLAMLYKEEKPWSVHTRDE
jgi:hypothetical protein